MVTAHFLPESQYPAGIGKFIYKGIIFAIPGFRYCNINLFLSLAIRTLAILYIEHLVGI